MKYKQAIDEAMREMVRKIMMEYADEINAMAIEHPDLEYDDLVSIMAKRIIQREPA